MAAELPEQGRGIGDQLHRLACAAASGLEVMGTVVILKSAEGSEAVAAASDEPSRSLAEIEFGLGEGPAYDAFALGRPVLAADLHEHRAHAWPGYAPAAGEAGIGAVHAFPLQLGASRFGVLSVFSDAARHLEADEVAKCLAFAALATEMLLDSSTAGQEGEIDPALESSLSFRSEVYQAQGMVMVALGLALPEALALMRAHAFTSGRTLIEVSREILARRLDLTDTQHDR